MIYQCKALKLEPPTREFRFHPTRRWRFDLAWPELKIACEVEGVLFWKQGRHQTGKGYTNDCEKYAEALVLGWKVLRVTPKQVKNGQAIGWLEQLF